MTNDSNGRLAGSQGRYKWDEIYEKQRRRIFHQAEGRARADRDRSPAVEPFPSRPVVDQFIHRHHPSNLSRLFVVPVFVFLF